jgi:HAD superfamily hydrolase (TIGR01490 family)
VKKAIAFFDFDGTITTKDTLLEFIRFAKGWGRFLWGFLVNSPWLVAMKLGLVGNQEAKERVLRYFFRGMPARDFDRLCQQFAQSVLPSLVRPAALDEISRLRENGSLIVVVSASPENWIRTWAQSQGLELIASQLEINNGKLTGRIAGLNCHGPEKVRRILEKHVITDYEEVYAYGDSNGDLPMLELATSRFYRPFRNPGKTHKNDEL